MPRVKFSPMDKEAEARSGITLLAAAIKAKVNLSHKCGGKGSCTTCKVKVLTPQACTPLSQKEIKMISVSQRTEGFRLACQTKVISDCQVDVPESPLQALIRRQLEAQRNKTHD